MRITWLEIENFQGIKKLRIDGLDKPRLFLEGPNDVGKSNLLRAIDIAFTALPDALAAQRVGVKGFVRPQWAADWGTLFRQGESTLRLSFGVRFEKSETARGGGVALPQEQGFSIVLVKKGSEISTSLKLLPDIQDTNPAVLDGVVNSLRAAFRLVAAERKLSSDALALESQSLNQLRWQDSNLKKLLFLYKNSPETEGQERFDQLREALRDPGLGVGGLNVSVQPDQTVNVRTRQGGSELDLEQRSAGVQQLVSLLTLTLCHRGRILALEDPELNLAEPLQRLLWKKLRGFTGEAGPVDQLFVTSHSRIFEEGTERLLVSRDPEAGTQARWAEPTSGKRQASDAEFAD